LLTQPNHTPAPLQYAEHFSRKNLSSSRSRTEELTPAMRLVERAIANARTTTAVRALNPEGDPELRATRARIIRNRARHQTASAKPRRCSGLRLTTGSRAIQPRPTTSEPCKENRR